MDDKQIFIDAEYCIDKYFDEYLKSRLEFYMKAREAAYVSSRTTGFGVTSMFMPSEEHVQDVDLNYEVNDINKVWEELNRDSHDIDLLAGAWQGYIQEKIGESRYKAYSEALGSDLASAYVRHRLTMRMVDYEAEKNPIRGSADYITDEARRHSILKEFKVEPVNAEIQHLIDKRKIENYDPSILEQESGKFLGLATDVISGLPFGFSTSWAGLAATAAIETGIHYYSNDENTPPQPPNVSHIVSSVVFGGYRDELAQFRRQTSSTNPYSSKVVGFVNENLNHKFMRRRETTNPLLTDAAPLGVKMDLAMPETPDYSSQLTDQVNAHFAIEEKFGNGGTPPAASDVPGASEEQPDAEEKKKKGEVAGWGGLLDNLGLGDFGTVGKNLGYVIAMLPDLLIGMFTGKSRHLKLDDNLLPLGSIVAGLFVKNPLLKMLLIGFGGANLLNKAGHEALDIRDGGRRQPVRQYLEYGDEVLDSRIKQPQVRGNTLLATIDNIPSVLTVNDEVIDAYEKGLIPLNTLCNAVLRKYDEQKAAVEESFIREDTQEDVVDRSHGLK